MGDNALATGKTVQFAAVLAVLLLAACGDDDAAPGKDGGADAGDKSDSGDGSSGSGGNSTTGSGGSKGTGSGTGAQGADEDGGGSGMPSSGSGQDAGTSAGGGAMDASTSGGGTMQAAPGCGGLLDCCAQLASMDRMSCELIANNADDASCDQYKLLVCPPANGDAGAAPDPNACNMLNDCCGTLPRGPVRVACATTVSSGVALDCQQVKAALCTTGGDPNACATLTACCNSLPKPQRKSCHMIADQGLPSACETASMALCPM